MKKVRGFSLLEMVIVLSILAILIVANRLLFSLPSKYIIESEQCVNTIHGEVTKFFYESITGKAKTTSVTGDYGITPEEYSIIFDGGYPNYGIDMGFIFRNDLGATSTSTVKAMKMESGSAENNIGGCLSNNHRVMLSGGVSFGGGMYPMKVVVNKNLSINNSTNAMTICAIDKQIGDDCLAGSQVYKGTIDYMICKNINGNYDTSSCEPFFKQYIDTRSQTIISRRCLSLPIDKPCGRRSIDSGYNL